MTLELKNKALEEYVKNLEKENEYLKTCVKNTKDLMELEYCQSEKRIKSINSLIGNQNDVIDLKDYMIKELNRAISVFPKMICDDCGSEIKTNKTEGTVQCGHIINGKVCGKRNQILGDQMTLELKDKTIEESVKNLEKENVYLITSVRNTKDLVKLQNSESKKSIEYLNSLIRNKADVIDSKEHMIKELKKTLSEFIKKSCV